MFSPCKQFEYQQEATNKKLDYSVGVPCDIRYVSCHRYLPWFQNIASPSSTLPPNCFNLFGYGWFLLSQQRFRDSQHI